jgi:sugar transferase (PEP-CTERM/EpsH1 system associated)
MHFAELDSDKWRQYSERSGPPGRWIYRREWKRLLEFERRLAAACRMNVLCTPLEEAIFRREIPGVTTAVLKNGVDLEYFRPRPADAEPGRIVFTGVMDYLPNADACVHFAREVLPRVRERFPSARFSIVGAHPAPRVRRLARLRAVEVTGFVPDTRDWLARASVAVAPLRIARGIQNKVLEALAMGLPVVGTTAATQGIEGTPLVHYLVADDAEAEAEAVIGLLADPAAARALGLRGRRLVEERYDWERTLEPLDRLLEELAPAPLRATTP